MNKNVFYIILVIIIVILIVGFVYIQNNRETQKNKESENIQENQELTNIDNNQETKNNNSNINEEIENNNITKSNNSAVIYFSVTNNTKKIAELIKTNSDSDIIEIIPKDKYTDNDINYGNDNSRANKEQNDDSARPEISNNIDVNKYETIYLGYPIWWGDVPKIILAFIDKYDLSGKTVIPFCTSGSSSISNSLSTLKKYNNKVNWVDGKRFDSSTTSGEIKNWLNQINR